MIDHIWSTYLQPLTELLARERAHHSNAHPSPLKKGSLSFLFNVDHVRQDGKNGLREFGILTKLTLFFALGLIVTRMALTGGTSPVQYLKAFNITLFLTSYENQVADAIRQGTYFFGSFLFYFFSSNSFFILS
jgi:hypothetical protein